MELTELYNTQGYKVWEGRAKEHQRNSDRKQQRKLFRANYARYAAEAKLKNIQRAAEKLIEERLAAEKAAAQNEAPQQAQPESLLRKPPTPTGDSELPKEAINTA